ncbi:AzlC family ABC transporter permease [Streptomyces sp. NBC_01465]|uniref:AzlC family ABC transporter permease n=1 Tax=Streptomyces sp. NBC_01465 TaxID=2903878 RepID=UPI002E3239E1|nr:AzlC family ABC transporter permease [Streptomyces sp. NBC_01465]
MGTPPPGHGLRSDIGQALKDSGAVGLGAFPMGVAFGVLVVHSGLAWWWASVFSTLIYAGSLEFLLIGLVVATAPLMQIALTAFLVNLRHVFYALSFPLHRVNGLVAKSYSTFALSDEAYAVTTGEAAQSYPRRRILWLQVFIHLYWAGGATAGALSGSLVPARVTGLEFAVTALFTVLAIDAYRARRSAATAALALACALLARIALPGQLLPAAFLMFTAVLVTRHALTHRSAHDA